MAKVNIATLANLQNEPSAVNTINNNFLAVQATIETLLSRDGTAPNQMTALLDMNERRIINLPAPVDPNDPVRYRDIGESVIEVEEARVEVLEARDETIAARDITLDARDTAVMLTEDFASTYLGSFSEDPPGPQDEGALYFNTALNSFFVYIGSSWEQAYTNSPALDSLVLAAEAARDDAVIAQGLAETARDETLEAQGDVEDLIDSLNFPASLSGASLNMLRVNAGETAYEYRTPDQLRSDLLVAAVPQFYTTGGHTAVFADRSAAMIFTSSNQTLDLTAAATLGAGWYIDVISKVITTVVPNGSELIDGASTLSIPPNCSCRIWCDGTAFYTNLSAIVTPWVAYTPTTQALGTISSVSIRSRRVGSNLEVMGKFVSGTPSGSSVQFGLGFNGVADNVEIASWVPSTGGVTICGVYGSTATSAFSGHLGAIGGLKVLRFVFQASGQNGLQSGTGTAVSSNGMEFGIHASVPIEGWQ